MRSGLPRDSNSTRAATGVPRSVTRTTKVVVERRAPDLRTTASASTAAAATTTAIAATASLARMIHHDRSVSAGGRSARTPGRAARIVLDVRDERDPAVHRELLAPPRSQP